MNNLKSFVSYCSINKHNSTTKAFHAASTNWFFAIEFHKVAHFLQLPFTLAYELVRLHC